MPFGRTAVSGQVGVGKVLAQLLVLDTLLRFVVGVHDHLVMHRILPGIGLALLLGNGASALLARAKERSGLSS